MYKTGGEATICMEHVVPAMYPVGETLNELYLSQGGVGNHEPFTGICGGNIANWDFLRELLGYDLEEEDREGYLFSFCQASFEKLATFT